MMLLKIALDFAKHLESKDLANINALLDPDCLWVLNGYIDKLEGASASVDYLKKIFKSHPDKALSLTNPVQNSENEMSLDYYFLPYKQQASQEKVKIGTLKLAIENNLIKKITTYSKAKPTSQDKPKKISTPETSRKPLLNAKPKLTYDPITGLPL
tara:strand:+ start:8121 stop:8588 length:468 start_codon:yes stop_codon:yes gene_type:complete